MNGAWRFVEFKSLFAVSILYFAKSFKEKRQQEGIAAKKARGEWADYGRPKAQKPSNWNEVIELWHNGEITTVKAMELTGLKKTTFYKLLKQQDQPAAFSLFPNIFESYIFQRISRFPF